LLKNILSEKLTMMIVPRYTYIIVKAKSVHHKSELILKRTMNCQAKNKLNKKFSASTSESLSHIKVIKKSDYQNLVCFDACNSSRKISFVICTCLLQEMRRMMHAQLNIAYHIRSLQCRSLNRWSVVVLYSFFAFDIITVTYQCISCLQMKFLCTNLCTSQI